MADRGVALLEVLIALVLVSVMALGGAHLCVVATASLRDARQQSAAVLLATQKLEQLRALTWSLGASAPHADATDLSTDLSVEPFDATGGGLGSSPAGTLAVDTPGYVDYLDAGGQWVGSGSPPAGAVYVRRWSVQPVPGSTDTVVLRVLVATIAQASRSGGVDPRRRAGTEALVATVRSRRAP